MTDFRGIRGLPAGNRFLVFTTSLGAPLYGTDVTRQFQAALAAIEQPFDADAMRAWLIAMPADGPSGDVHAWLTTPDAGVDSGAGR